MSTQETMSTQADLIAGFAPAPTVITVGDWLIDEATGEVIDRICPKPEFHVTDRDTADWVLEKLSEVDGEISGLQARLAAVQERMQTMIAEQTRRRDWLLTRFGGELEALARQELGSAKTKTLKLTWGKLSLRNVAGSIKVIDTAAALDWAKAYAPEAVQVRESLVVTPLKGREAELPFDCFEVTPARETFSVSTEVK